MQAVMMTNSTYVFQQRLSEEEPSELERLSGGPNTSSGESRRT